MAVDPKTNVSLSPEIAKYSAILNKDPNSLVFAPLAEAYRKAGMLDEAIRTAEEGLRLHPNYLSGMVVLGRAYYDKGMLKEAGGVLEQVTRIAPDNIVAARILEEIKQKAEGGRRKAEELPEEAVSQVGWAAPAGLEEVSEVPEVISREPGVRSQEIEAEVEGAGKPEISGEMEPGVEAVEPELVELEEVPEVEELEAEEEAGAAFGEEITNELWTGESFTESPESVEEAKPRKEITTETIAELYIKQGYIDRAIDVYQMLHDAHPENEEIKRKLEELKGKVKVEAMGEVPLTPTLSPEGRGGEAVEDENVKRLKAWLDMVRKERRKG